MPNKKILLCGGGNAIHVLTSYIGAQPDCDVYIFSSFPGEADRLREALDSSEKGVQCLNDLGDDKFGKPVKISDKAEEVVPGADVIILAVPSFTHQTYLKQVAPYVEPGVVIGAMPGEGGFDLCARHVFGNDFVDQSNVFALETLPWACRIVDYGKKVEVLGTKQEIDVVISEGKLNDSKAVLELLQKLVGPKPVLKPACNFLAVTLMNINSVWHPTISYSFYRNWDGKTPFDEPPLFYYGADEYTGEKLSLVSDEVLELGRVMKEKYPTLDLSSLYHVREWMLRSYGDDIGDKTSIYTMLVTNKGYRGLTHPTVKVETADGTKYMPNFKYRYFTEDIPMGLAVTKGIAELAGVATPNLDDVMEWCQKNMGKEYVVNGKFCGKDISSTRSPQAYGFTDLDTFLKINRYIA